MLNRSSSRKIPNEAKFTNNLRHLKGIPDARMCNFVHETEQSSVDEYKCP